MTTTERNVVLASLLLLVALEALLIQHQPPKGYEYLFSSMRGHVGRDLYHSKVPLIALYDGSHPTKQGSWTTAFWAGWGADESNLQDGHTVALPWAADGIVQAKSCDVPCFVTRDQTAIAQADAVVMEIVNHERTFGSEPMVFPARSQSQLWGSFFFEPEEHFEDFLQSGLLKKNLDFSMTPSKTSTMPITLVCPWGRDRSSFLLPPPEKEAFICTFSYSVPVSKQSFMLTLMDHLSVDAFIHDRYPATLPARMEIMAKHRFVFITEALIAHDWVSPEWSQAILAGAVPVYLGAPNIEHYSPGKRSYVNANHFSTGEALAQHLKFLNENEEAYLEYFKWKEEGLSANFIDKLEKCAHFGECRICHHVLEKRKEWGIDE